MTAQHADFDAAVTELLSALDSGELPRGCLDVLMRGLGRFLRARFTTLSRDDVVEAANEGLVRFVAAASEGKVDPGRRPAGYLTRIAENAAVDVLRRRRHESPDADVVSEHWSDEDPLDDLVDALSGEAIVLEVMAAARDRSEHELNAVLEVFLDLADEPEREKPPTLRELGGALGISHTEVRRRLARLGSLIDELADGY